MRHVGDSTFEHAPANYHVFAAANMGEDAGVEALVLNFAAETKLTAIESRNKDFVVEGDVLSRRQLYASCSLQPAGPHSQAGFCYRHALGRAHAHELWPDGERLCSGRQLYTLPNHHGCILRILRHRTINGATRMAIDGGDILYIADTRNNKVKEMDSSGVLINNISSPIATPASLAADSFGILYTTNTPGNTYYFSVYYPWGSETACDIHTRPRLYAERSVPIFGRRHVSPGQHEH